jgi:PAP2 superfamily
MNERKSPVVAVTAGLGVALIAALIGTIVVMSKKSATTSTAASTTVVANGSTSTTGSTTASPATTVTTVTESPNTAAPAPVVVPASRQWMLIAQEIVKTRKPSPPAQARLYAYASKTYDDVLVATGDSKQAGEATRQVLAAISPEDTDLLAKAGTDIGVTATLDAKAQAVVAAHLARMKIDGTAADKTADKTPPAGDGKWVSKNNQVPAAVTAGAWTRWFVPANTDFAVPAPNAFGSAELKADVEKTRLASETRDARWVAAINYWGGTPGTEGPSGVWQNHVWRNVQGSKLIADDGAYAHMQSVLAQSLADSFIETWKIKYTYWTARPDMLDPIIRTSMPNPPFPGYVSGHSTISATAATVLASLVPDKAAFWMTSAEEARDSRLYAGIHLSQDNAEGFALGKKVGATVLDQLKAKPAPTPAPTVATSVTPKPTTAPAKPALAVPAEIGRGTLPSETSPGYHGGTGASLWKVSKAGHARAFLMASDVQPETTNGWAATKLHTDDVWQPGACSSSPSVVVGDRYQVFSEWIGDGQAGGRTVFGVFDTTAGTFRKITWSGASGSYPTGSLTTPNDHSLSVVAVDKVKNRVMARTIDITNGTFVDRDLPGVEGLGLTEAEGLGATRARMSSDGHLRISDSLGFSVNGIVALNDLSARDEVVFVDSKGATRAKIFNWRSPYALGWTESEGYFVAQPKKDGAGWMPGVYNTAATNWDWAISETAPTGNYVHLGTLPA